jgi:hypothetical protein
MGESNPCMIRRDSGGAVPIGTYDLGLFAKLRLGPGYNSETVAECVRSASATPRDSIR